jgi:hypothetical protein
LPHPVGTPFVLPLPVSHPLQPIIYFYKEAKIQNISVGAN